MLVKLINSYVRAYRRQLFMVLIAQIVAVSASLSMPMFNGLIIDRGVSQGDISKIWLYGGLMLLVAIIQISGQMTAVFAGAYTASGFSRDVRGAVFDKVLKFSRQEVNRFTPASLITRNTNDVQQVQQLVLMTCIMMISAPLTMIGGVIMAVRTDALLSWTVLAAVVVLGSIIGVIITRVSPLFQANQNRIDVVNQRVREQISGVRVIRAFVRENLETHRFDQANRDLLTIMIKVGSLQALLFPLAMLVMNLSSVAVMWFGAWRVDGGHMQVGMLTAFLTYLMQILMSVMMATMMLMMAPRAAVSAKRIMEVLDSRSTLSSPPHPVNPDATKASLVFSHVDFRYPGAENCVLSDISFQIKPGQTTAIIGSTGSGKTTLVNLVPRLFDVSAGSVVFNGVDVREMDLEFLWSKIGLVPQQGYLFTGTIASNLRYANPDASDEQLWSALEIAQVADFVKEIGLDAPVAQGGTNFSGGQRQRLSIARALVRKPEIYIFDDAFSALDVATDVRLRAALAKNISDASVLIVAQRISSIRDADQIIVLGQGRIQAVGTHEQLLKSSPTYLEIVQSQMSLEEAA